MDIKNMRCKECGGRLRKSGFREYLSPVKKERIQQYQCIDCGKRSIHYVEVSDDEQQQQTEHA